MNEKMKQNKGFSFLELLVAMTILSVVMILVTQFMSTSTGAIGKTNKNLDIQTEALEIGEQISDIIMQASYIRVQDVNGKNYVVDNYPNWTNGKQGTSNKKIVLKKDDTDPADQKVYIANEDGNEYATDLLSFRTLEYATANITPQYIFIQYATKDSGTEQQRYLIYYFHDNNIDMYRGDVSSSATDDYFNEAVTKVSGADAAVLTKNVKESEFNADVEANTVSLDIVFEEQRYHKYTYTYSAPIKFRNTYVLTVAPQKLFEYR